MKRPNTRDISSFFTKKTNKENDQCQAQASEHEAPEISLLPPPQASEQNSSPSVNVPEPQPEFDIMNLPRDPGKRKKISDFHPNERDLVRRTYIQRGPCQPEDFVFPQTQFGIKERRFNVKWFDTWRQWLEYSVCKDAAFCFICYLFKAENTVGGDAFVNEGFKAWNRLSTIRDHVGKQAIRVVEALSLGELETGSGLNQERGLGRPCDTRWGSHFKTILNVLDLYPTILESLDVIAEVSDTLDSNKA